MILPQLSPGPWAEPIHDVAKVKEVLRYWDRGAGAVDAAVQEGIPPQSPGKFVTFFQDCGGFNNIRMGFEHAILMAWATGRTLVLPPPEPWYLIDFGPFHAGKPSESRVTDYHDFFQVDRLRRLLPGGIISSEEFFRREINPELRSQKTRARGKKEVQRHLDKLFGSIAGNPMSVVWIVGTPKTPWSGEILDGRKQWQFSDYENRKVMHFAGCQIGEPRIDQFRTLGQIATSVLFADPVTDRAFRNFRSNFP
eukprot:Hpha_TRINITY_DN4430_c0_g1::TRINITY_DN4430_c0_g1_i2::g.50557::m.50557